MKVEPECFHLGVRWIAGSSQHLVNCNRVPVVDFVPDLCSVNHIERDTTLRGTILCARRDVIDWRSTGACRVDTRGDGRRVGVEWDARTGFEPVHASSAIAGVSRRFR